MRTRWTPAEEVGLAGTRDSRASQEAIAMSKELRHRGWSLVGPTTVHSFLKPWVSSTTTWMHVRFAKTSRMSDATFREPLRGKSVAAGARGGHSSIAYFDEPIGQPAFAGTQERQPGCNPTTRAPGIRWDGRDR
jgi:hypothetical protein